MSEQFQSNWVNLLKALMFKKIYLTVLLLCSLSVFAEDPSWVQALDSSREAKVLFLKGDFVQAAGKYRKALELLKKGQQPELSGLVKQQRVAWIRNLTICNKFSANKTVSVEEQLTQQKLEMVRLLKRNMALKDQLSNNGNQTLKIKALQDQIADLKSERDALMDLKKEQNYKFKRKQQDQVYVTACLGAQRLYSKSYQNLKRVNIGLSKRNITLQRSIEDFKKQQRKLIGSSFYETIQSEISDLKLTNNLLFEKLKQFEGQEASPNTTIDILQNANYKLRADRDQFYHKLEQYTGDAFETQLALTKELKKKNKQLQKEIKHYEVLTYGQQQILDRLFKESTTYNIALNQLEMSNSIKSNLEDEIRFLKEELARQKIINRLLKVKPDPK